MARAIVRVQLEDINGSNVDLTITKEFVVGDNVPVGVAIVAAEAAAEASSFRTHNGGKGPDEPIRWVR